MLRIGKTRMPRPQYSAYESAEQLAFGGWPAGIPAPLRPRLARRRWQFVVGQDAAYRRNAAAVSGMIAWSYILPARGSVKREVIGREVVVAITNGKLDLCP